MKINLKISLKQLRTLITLLNANKLAIPMNRTDKVSSCNIEKVRLKVKKLWVVWEDKVDLFSHKKKVSLNLDYSEAHYFEKFIELCNDWQIYTEEYNHLHKIKLFIDEKLA